METDERKHLLPKWAVDLLIWLLPGLILLALCISAGLVFLRTNIAIFVNMILIGLAVTRLIFLFRSERAASAKVWCAILWGILLAVLVFLSLLMPFEIHRTTHINAQERFETAVAKKLPDALATSLELGAPDSVVCHTMIQNSIWSTQSNILLCRYDEEEYRAVKGTLETGHRCRTELFDSRCTDNEGPVLLEPYISIGDDHFRFLWPLDGDRESWDFFKRSLLMVTNDKTHEIGFIFFNDIELDYVEDMEEFIYYWCGWEYIR